MGRPQGGLGAARSLEEAGRSQGELEAARSLEEAAERRPWEPGLPSTRRSSSIRPAAANLTGTDSLRARELRRGREE